MAYNTDRAVVIVGRIVMVMQCCHESGKNEKEYKKYGKLTALVHVPALEPRLIYAVVFVKKSFKKYVKVSTVSLIDAE